MTGLVTVRTYWTWKVPVPDEPNVRPQPDGPFKRHFHAANCALPAARQHGPGVTGFVRKELLGEDGRGGCSVRDGAARRRRRRAVAARPLRSSARLSLGRSLSAQCSAGGVSHQPRTERSHARPMRLSGAAICRGSGAISPMTLCGKRPTRCRPAASSMAATRSSSSRVERWEGRQASCFTCSRW